MSMPHLTDFRRIVVKVGSSLLVDARRGRAQRGVARRARRRHRASARRRARRAGRVVGRDRARTPRARLPAGTLKLEDSQAAAAVGQIALARTWAETLGRHGIAAGQVLVTLGDTEERRRYLYARSTLARLLEWRAVPVINENDTVATNEIRYGDNDRLAARVATMASADLLVLLSDVDGLYDAPPGANARREADRRSCRASRRRSRPWPAAPPRNLSRGGMRTKIEAGKIADPAAPIW